MITPTIAKHFLEFNTGKQRPKKKWKITEYATAMKRGDWACTGETIKFDTDKKLIDGQNRLYAVIQAGVPVEFDIVRNIDPAAYIYLDSGKNRTGGDALSCEGKKNSVALSAAIDACTRYLDRSPTGGLRVTGITNRERQRFLVDNPNIEESMSFIIKHREALSLFSGTSFFAGYHYLFKQFDQQLANDFISSVAYGTNLYKGSSIGLLRNRLLKDKINKAKLTQPEKRALVVIAWNAYVTTKKLGALIWRKGGDGRYRFPAILGVEG